MGAIKSFLNFIKAGVFMSFENLAQTTFLALLHFVRNDGVLIELLDGRIFGEQSDGQDFPQVVFLRSATRRVRTIHGASDAENTDFKICCAALDSLAVAKIAEQIASRLDELSGEMDGVYFDAVNVQTIEMKQEDGLFVAFIDVNVWARPALDHFLKNQFGAWQGVQEGAKNEAV